MAKKVATSRTKISPPSNLLPAPSAEPLLHRNLTLLETADALELDLILASPKISTLLVRLAPTVVVAMPGQDAALLEQLRQLGHTPKIRGGDHVEPAT